MYFLINKMDELKKQVKIFLICISLVIIIISFGYIFFHFENYSNFISNTNVFVSNLYIFFDFIIYPPLLYILYNFEWVNNFCNTRFIKYLGKISYGIYLWNFPILGGTYLLIRFLKLEDEYTVKYWFLIWIIMAVLHFILSVLSYNFLEKRFYYRKKSTRK